MLSLRNIVKDYSTGSNAVRALNGISLEFRKNEFVSILGPSGCGKTTLLNIIGGLDQYTSGDLVINGVSTKRYQDADWDTYRNHSIGFVFQNYNLIPHQTVLANVELALTLSGVSKAERRRRASDALRMVGLEWQLNKKPTQMSGGQMQRVAIARALVNDPEILLADEPTGALDTKTSVQIMDILRQISKTRLVIMVTHNPDLARRYSSRIIRLLDGRLVNDSNPYRPTSDSAAVDASSQREAQKKDKRRRNPFAVTEADLRSAHLAPQRSEAVVKKKGAKRSMSFFTALSLSFNNLLTKKGRTFMTSFAGSIGIIGIALILSVSTGVNNYINSVQRETLASYPIQLESETEDLSALITTLMGAGDKDRYEHELDKVYESAVIAELFNSFNSIESSSNDLKSFKAYMEANKEAFAPYLSATQFTYDFNWSIFTKDEDGSVVESDVMKLFESIAGTGDMSASMGSSSMMMGAGFDIWEEMLTGTTEDELINPLIKEQYDLVYGEWPDEYNEVLLVVDKNNEISDLSLYALGLRTEKEIRDDLMTSTGGGLLDTEIPESWTYEEICSMTFRMLLASECYQKQANNVYADMSQSKAGREYLYNNNQIGTSLRVVGIIRANEDATSTLLTGTIAYTSALSDYALEKTQNSALLKAQLADPTVDVLTGLPFATSEDREPTAEDIRTAVADYVAKLSVAQKAELYTTLISTPTAEMTESFVAMQMEQLTPESIREMLIYAFSTQIDLSPEELESYVDHLDAETQATYVKEILALSFAEQYAAQAQLVLAGLTIEQIAERYDLYAPHLTAEQYQFLYDTYVPRTTSESTYEDNLFDLGYVREESPDSIYLYASSFENKDAISDLIAGYNDSVEEEQRIAYTDYVALLMSSITTIVNAISYVLIAFVAISLIVSSIMIGIITYISVLERTKEIGILRAIGASKRDIRRVFNAETLLIGFVSGAIGILMTLGLNVVVNVILFHFTQIASLKAALPIEGAIILVIISMMLTLIAGLFPSGIAAKKNPVEALRTE